jgi:hypothetical protein
LKNPIVPAAPLTFFSREKKVSKEKRDILVFSFCQGETRTSQNPKYLPQNPKAVRMPE